MSAERKPVSAMSVLEYLASHDWDGDARPGNAAVAEALRAVAELVSAAADLIERFRHKGETHNECHDRVAAEFLRDTGIPAPSNERSPLHSDRERWDAYEAWSAAKRDRLNAALTAMYGGAK